MPVAAQPFRPLSATLPPVNVIATFLQEPHSEILSRRNFRPCPNEIWVVRITKIITIFLYR